MVNEHDGKRLLRRLFEERGYAEDGALLWERDRNLARPSADDRLLSDMLTITTWMGATRGLPLVEDAFLDLFEEVLRDTIEGVER